MTPTAARLARLLPPPDPRPDGALLAAFLADRDEAAFAELVRRHGPLVLAACRRLLPDPTDAEDAFQAAFLVLVRRARRLTSSPALGPWLYRVAVWTARNVRRRNARRLARTTPLPDAIPAPPASHVPALDLDAALLALPEKYRTPLVLCHLQGWSRRDAAARLGCPEGTLSALLSRGLVKLRGRLRGYDPAAALAVGLTVVPPALTAATVTGATATRATVAPAVAELTASVLRMLWVPKAAAGLAAVFALGAGVGLSVREAPAVAQVPAAPAPRPVAEKATPHPLDLLRLEQLLTDIEQERAQLVIHERNEGNWKTVVLRCKREWEEARDRLNGLPADTPANQRDAAEVEEIRARTRLKDIETRAAGTAAALTISRARVQELQRFLTREPVMPEVAGTLATDVAFPDTGRMRVGVAARALAVGALRATDRVSVAAWDAARRGAHVHVRYPVPYPALALRDGREVALAEVVISLPLTREPGGFVLVRDGDRIVRLTGLPPDACDRFQAALASAVPAGR